MRKLIVAGTFALIATGAQAQYAGTGGHRLESAEPSRPGARHDRRHLCGALRRDKSEQHPAGQLQRLRPRQSVHRRRWDADAALLKVLSPPYGLTGFNSRSAPSGFTGWRPAVARGGQVLL
jgi:hypothetical protein